MSVRLRVVDPPESLSDRRVGLSASVMRQLGVEAGDVVSVRGGGRTAAVVEPLGDDHGGVCLPDAVCRNADIDPGGSVVVEPADAAPAASVTVRLDRSLSVTRAETALRRRLDGTAVSVGDAVEVTHLGGALTLPFTVEDVEPSSPGLVGEQTEFVVVTDDTADVAVEPTLRDEETVVPAATYRRLRETVGTRLDAAETFASAGRPATLGLLLYGPRGSGKTTLAEAVAAATDASFVRVSAANLRSERRDDRAEQLDRAVDAAADADRAVVLLDDLDAVGDDGAESALGYRLRAAVDDLRAADGTVVIGATTDRESVPDALRRGGRFDREIEVGPLTVDDRRAALEAVSQEVPLSMDVDFAATAERINGFVLADVTTLVDTALERAIQRDGRTAVRQADLDHAVDAVEPSGLRNVAVEFPAVAWDEVGGLDAAKREIVRAVYWPLEYAERFERLGTDPPSGVLLSGPPGTGKTLLARAAASLSDANFISVNGPELLNRYVGASERAVRDLFTTARENAPAVVFFDEVDAISSKRRGNDTGVGERVVSQLLTELDGLEPLTDVVVVAATNRPEMIDEALLRPGRIETTVETPLPDRAARREILAIHTRETPTAPGVDLADLADRTAGYSGGDLAALVREAAMLAIEDTIDGGTQAADVAVDATHFDRALADMTPSVSGSDAGSSEEEADETAG